MSDDPGRALEAVLKLTALEERTAELRKSLDRIERKLEALLDRLANVEAQQGQLPEGLRDEIVAELRAELTRGKDRLDPETRSLLILSSEE